MGLSKHPFKLLGQAWTIPRMPRAAFLLLLATFALTGCGGSTSLLDSYRHSSVFDNLKHIDVSPRDPEPQSAGRQGTSASEGRLHSAQLFPKDGGGPRSLQRVRSQLRPARGIGARNGQFELNFQGASLADVTQVILGDTLKATFTYDPRLTGQVTLSTGRPISKNELLDVLEAVLQMNGAALVAQGGGYQVVPAGDARSGTVDLLPADPGGSSVPGYGVSVLALRHVAAAQMLEMMDGFLARSGGVRADIMRNLLLLRGSGRERQNLVDVAATFDQNWLRDRAAGIFPLRFAEPDDVKAELSNVLELGRGGRGRGLVRIEPIKRLNAILAVTQSNEMLDEIATWVKRLDKSNADGVNVYVYEVRNGKAARLAKILRAAFGDGDTNEDSGPASVAPGQTASRLSDNRSDSPSGFSRSGQTAGAGPQKGSTDSLQPSGEQTAAELDAEIEASGSGKIQIVPDPSNNTIVIRAREADYKSILSALRRLDKPPLQVMINATIAEVTLNDNLRYGVQFYLRAQDFGSDGNWAINVAKETGLPLAQAFPGLNYVLGSLADPRLVLDALSGVTKVQVVSSPSVVVLHNQPARLKVGAEVPVITQQATSTENVDSRIVNSIEFRDTGVILKVTPRVSSSGLVTMEVEQEISSVASSSEPGTLTPTINQRRINSTIAVYSGQSVLLGGLISEEDSSDKEGVPGVDRVPVLGDIIGHKQRAATRTELIVFIRPQVIRDGHDATNVAEEVAQRLRLMSARDDRERASRWRTHREYK